jgi:hypothetical protein
MTVSTRGRPALLVVLVAIGLAGCDGDGSRYPDTGAWRAEVDTLGDTIIVHTVAGSVWGDTADLVEEVRIGSLEGADEYVFGRVAALAVGERGVLYVLDEDVPVVRAYSPDGTYQFDVGREGKGPGEYMRPDGLATLPDGRVIIRDPGNARLSVYTPDGRALDGWRHQSGGAFSTFRRFYVDTAGNSYVTLLLNLGVRASDWRMGLGRVSPNGQTLDTLPAPTWEHATPQVTFSRGVRGVPFTPAVAWGFSPLGYMVAGLATDYRIDLFRIGEPVLRIEREWTPIPVEREEAEEQRERITASFRRIQGNWSWNGPDIPDTKPPYRGLFVDDDNRVWVLVSQRARAIISEAEASEEERVTGRRPLRFREPPAFDVFDAEGRYLGHVRAPESLRYTRPEPIIRGDTAWAVVTDELDVPSVVRFRIARGNRI